MEKWEESMRLPLLHIPDNGDYRTGRSAPHLSSGLESKLRNLADDVSVAIGGTASGDWPHAIVFDGMRWHARAYCFEHREFRDFIMARILQCELTENENVDASVDDCWNTEVTLTLVTASNLTEGQKRVVALEYGWRSIGCRFRPEKRCSYMCSDNFRWSQTTSVLSIIISGRE